MIDASSPNDPFFEYLLRLGDDRLVLGHRLSEWCGHAPILEEDIALANISLDLIGQANFILDLAGEVEGQGRNADDLAYRREAIDFRNSTLVEQPNGDFGKTIARQFLFDAHSMSLLSQLQHAKSDSLAGIAAKALKEDTYHLRHSRQWVLRLGDGTEESQNRIQDAFDELWRFTGELFEEDEIDRRVASESNGADLSKVEAEWRATVRETLHEATLVVPDETQFMISGSRQGRHTEHLGLMLAQMQILARSYPGAKW